MKQRPILAQQLQGCNWWRQIDELSAHGQQSSTETSDNRNKDELVSLRQLKEISQSLLPQGSVLRNLILTEPDYLPYEEAMTKIGIFLRLLYGEVV